MAEQPRQHLSQSVERHPDGIATVRAGGGGQAWGGASYRLGIAAATVGSAQLSMNVATVPPGGALDPHVHVGFEVGLYILAGRIEHRFGPGLRSRIVNEAGDFIFVAPDVPHTAVNLSQTEPVTVVVARTSAGEWSEIAYYDAASVADDHDLTHGGDREA